MTLSILICPLNGYSSNTTINRRPKEPYLAFVSQTSNCFTCQAWKQEQPKLQPQNLKLMFWLPRNRKVREQICKLLFHLTGHTVLNSAIITMVWNFNHWPWGRASSKIIRKCIKIWTKIELNNTIWLVWKSVHESRRIAATTIKISESNPLAYPIFEK